MFRKMQRTECCREVTGPIDKGGDPKAIKPTSSRKQASSDFPTLE